MDLDPEAWLPHLAQAALLEWDMSSSALQADFQRENAGTLAGIAAQLRSANVPVCTTMVIDDIIYWKLFQPEPEARKFHSILAQSA